LRGCWVICHDFKSETLPRSNPQRQSPSRSISSGNSASWISSSLLPWSRFLELKLALSELEAGKSQRHRRPINALRNAVDRRRQRLCGFIGCRLDTEYVLTFLLSPQKLFCFSNYLTSRQTSRARRRHGAARVELLCFSSKERTRAGHAATGQSKSRRVPRKCPQRTRWQRRSCVEIHAAGQPMPPKAKNPAERHGSKPCPSHVVKAPMPLCNPAKQPPPPPHRPRRAQDPPAPRQ